MKKEKHHVKIVSDEKDFSAVLDIITTHRSRALMSVNVESLLTYWEIGAFLPSQVDLFYRPVLDKKQSHYHALFHR